jgi:hypothetical protein
MTKSESVQNNRREANSLAWPKSEIRKGVLGFVASAILGLGFTFSDSVTYAAETSCGFSESTHSFPGTPLEQARCLLRPVLRNGLLGKPLAILPSPLEELIGKPVKFTPLALQTYLASHQIAEADIGGAVTNKLAAKYFVIHDTSTPNYLDQPIPTNINTASWSHNGLERWLQRPVAHVFVNRLGQSITPRAWIASQRATKLEVRVLGEKSRGLFVHTELVQPRQRDPQGSARNDAIAPTPGFTEVQLDRLALLFVSASVQHGNWMIPGFHACVDAGIPDAHDDPQNFDLALWAARVAKLLNDLENGPK